MEDRRLLSFSVAINYPVGLNPQATVAGDFNNDGHTDLAVANRGANTVSVLPGNGDGTFQAARTSAAGYRPQSLVAGDLNGDGKTDLVTGDLSVLLGNGDDFFQAPRSVSLPAQTNSGGLQAQTPLSAVVCDLNADGRLDLVAGGSTVYYVLVGYDPDTHSPIYQGHSDGYVNVLLGNGDGTFAPGTAYHLGSDSFAPSNLAVGDFDGNGKLDVVTDAGGLTTLLGNGDGTLQTPRRSAGSSYYAVGGGSLPMADFNRDGKLDLLMRDGSDTAVVVMLGNGDGTFRQTQPMFVNALHSAAVGDINADGKSDVVVLNSNYTDETQVDWASSAHVLLGKGDGTFAPPSVFELGLPRDNYFRSAVLADFDGDGYPDLAGSASFFDYDIEFQGFVAVARNVGNWPTRTWVGPTTAGNWSTAANWSPAIVPTVNDSVAIAGSSITLSTSATLRQLSLSGGASLTLAAAGNGVLRASGLSIAAGSKLNLNDNALIVDYTSSAAGSPMNSILALLAAGQTGGAFPTGIYSAAANASGGTYALAVAEASDVLHLAGSQTALFAGQTVDATSVLVKQTLSGDANLDGRVDFGDLARMAQNYNTTGGTWAQGDFTGDGNVDFNDLAKLAQNYNTSLPGVAPAASLSFQETLAAAFASPAPAPTRVTPVKPPPTPARVPKAVRMQKSRHTPSAQPAPPKLAASAPFGLFGARPIKRLRAVPDLLA